MKTKCLAYALCLLLALSVSGLVVQSSAKLVATEYPDDVSDTVCVADRDLKSASALFHPYPIDGGPPEFITLGIKMEDFSTLPGFISWDFDIDAAANVDDCGSLMCIPFDTEEGGCSPVDEDTGYTQTVGWDFNLAMILRTQDDGANIGHCRTCEGSLATCVERGASCTGDCSGKWNAGTSCDGAPATCYQMIGDQTCTGQGTCYDLTTQCQANPTSCERGFRKGEWGANWKTNFNPASRGRNYLPVDVDMMSETEFCVTLPWKQMVQEIRAEDPLRFSEASANNYANTKFRVAIWHDSDFADGNDFFSYAPIRINLADWLPADGKLAVDSPPAYTPPDKPVVLTCNGDFDGDGDNDGTDAFGFKTDFGKVGCPQCY